MPSHSVLIKPLPPKPRWVPRTTPVSCADLNKFSWSSSVKPRLVDLPSFPSRNKSCSRFEPTTPPQAKPALDHQSRSFVDVEGSPSYAAPRTTSTSRTLWLESESACFFAFSFFAFFASFFVVFVSRSEVVAVTTTGAAAAPCCTPYFASCSASNFAMRSSLPERPPNVEPR